MKIDSKTQTVTFDNLLDVEREFGSTETVSTPIPAEIAVARNAPGDFKPRSLEDAHQAGIDTGKKLAEMLRKK